MTEEKNSPDEKTLEQFAEEHEAAVLRELEPLQRKLKAANLERTRLSADNRRLTTELDMVQRALEESKILEPEPAWLRPKRRKGEAKRSTIVTILSDVHGGERVEPAEMQGYNAYNLRIMDLRLRRFFEKLVYLARDGYLGPTERDGIVLALGGDMSSGDIHDELKETNELSVYETVLWLAPRIVAGLEMWAEEFKSVHVVSTPGNHPRDSRVPRYKKRSAHNADTLLAKMVAFYFGKQNETGVTFDIPDAFDASFRVYGWRFSLEHGDELQKNNPGTSEIGALGPAKRGTLRKARQAQEEGHPFDYLLLGHFHQFVPAAEQGFVMNGSLKGYDEFARGWHLKPEQPQQAALVVTPEYGITNAVPVKVSKRSEEKW